MFKKIKNYLHKKIFTIVSNFGELEKKKMWWRFTALPNINIHHTFAPKDVTIFKGNEGKFGNITIGETFFVRDYCNISVLPGANLIIGNGVFFNNYSSVNCIDTITIGDNTIFGEGVKLYDHNHKYGFNADFFVDKTAFKTGAITIGKNCWIGSNTVILKGVEIGDNCIIGAGCVIHKSVPSNTIIKNSQNLISESLQNE
ncbi:acyltransferase [Chryseobacterium gleum]|uniref:acyltransferase n=1 Tax=Chryseobacterium gleum TaxID=250 RepID=UPI001039F83B|nr:acyltransferase [Chryseobacterium gleum]MCD9618688.1 acyltransferase [Chryseobacterium gleum]MCE4065356.1 acyltransferase [Chryseobacterium gleum]QBJ87600.1 acyltransferase [Chryseobacterium gleum]